MVTNFKKIYVWDKRNKRRGEFVGEVKRLFGGKYFICKFGKKYEQLEREDISIAKSQIDWTKLK
jgi:hypothetical protein